VPSICETPHGARCNVFDGVRLVRVSDSVHREDLIDVWSFVSLNVCSLHIENCGRFGEAAMTSVKLEVSASAYQISI